MRSERLIAWREPGQSCQCIASGVATFVGSLSNSFDKYLAPSAPFGGNLVSNTVGWIAVPVEDVLATRFLYPAW